MYQTMTCAPVERQERKLDMSEFRERVEDVLRTGDRAGACALVPSMRVLAARLQSLRRRCPELAGVGFSKYVMAVARLAGRLDEFAEFAAREDRVEELPQLA